MRASNGSLHQKDIAPVADLENVPRRANLETGRSKIVASTYCLQFSAEPLPFEVFLG